MSQWEIAYAYEGTDRYYDLLKKKWEPFAVLDRGESSNIIYFKKFNN